jgi:suppressor of ftsI/bilirubin oxidase
MPPSKSTRPAESIERRQVLKALAALGLSALPGRALADYPAAAASGGDFCGAGPRGKPLFIPGASGAFGRFAPGGAPFAMRAGAAADASPWALAYTVESSGKRFINPTLVLRRGERVRLAFANALAEPTIVHWHGLALDSRNDGGGMTLAAPGEPFDYDFEVRNRAGLYWYHPHPHGLTAGQAYRGLFGLIEIEDPDEAALRAALDLTPGRSEIPLVLQDRRAGNSYAASSADQMHGFLGEQVLINGTACPHLDLATRIYRFRVLNASNARTYRLAFRTAAGKGFTFALVGTDGGLLPAPQTCAEAFVAASERIDIVLDLSDASVGDRVLLETRAFDPMHMEMAAPASDATAPADHADHTDHAAMGHAMPTPEQKAPPAAMDHAAMGHTMPMPEAKARSAAPDHAARGHGGSFPEGAPRALLELRVRERATYRAKIPARLSAPQAIDTANASERPIRLGFAKGRWRINDRVFAMGETPIEVKRNTVETWLIRNYFNSMPHAMHLHGFHFSVLERQTSPDQVAALKIDDRGRLATDLGRKDTVLVWPGESVRIAIDFALPAAPSFSGDQIYVFHCHNLEHEDGGMMVGVRVT